MKVESGLVWIFAPRWMWRSILAESQPLVVFHSISDTCTCPRQRYITIAGTAWPWYAIACTEFNCGRAREHSGSIRRGEQQSPATAHTQRRGYDVHPTTHGRGTHDR
ncbi:hypothetical protein DFH27DRAFT_141039 [Peziza echinospora]|nr:hypothetical protein DFH27DRAFT_141039 [Peziza echinospora]